METTYVLDANDPATEHIWEAYKRQQMDVRGQIGTAYRAIDVALALYQRLAAELESGSLAAVASYHIAKAQPILDEEDALVGHMVAALDMIEKMNEQAPGVFSLAQRESERPTEPQPAADAMRVFGKPTGETE